MKIDLTSILWFAVLWFAMTAGLFFGFVIPTFSKILVVSLFSLVLFFIGAILYDWNFKQTGEVR